jgi:hypothetical protein
MDPLTLTAGAIAKLAFDEFVKSGAGELAKKSVGGAIDRLRSTIKTRFQGNKKAETAIATLETPGDLAPIADKEAALTKLSVYLEDEMDDAPFAENLQQLAQQVVNIGKQEQNTTQINVQTHDNSTANTVATLNNSGSGDVTFGDKVQGDKVLGDKVAGDKNI